MNMSWKKNHLVLLYHSDEMKSLLNLIKIIFENMVKIIFL